MYANICYKILTSNTNLVEDSKTTWHTKVYKKYFFLFKRLLTSIQPFTQPILFG